MKVNKVTFVLPRGHLTGMSVRRDPLLKLNAEPFGIISDNNETMYDHTFYLYSHEEEVMIIPSHECDISRVNERTLLIRFGEKEYYQDIYSGSFVLVKMMRVR
jgi:hypothetical protein